MSSDDLIGNQPNTDDDNKEMQPTMTAMFRLIQGVESRLTARLDEVESRLTRDIAGLNTRVTEGFKELTHKTNALNRRRFSRTRITRICLNG